jgi:hypothetical protein
VAFRQRCPRLVHYSQAHQLAGLASPSTPSFDGSLHSASPSARTFDGIHLLSKRRKQFLTFVGSIQVEIFVCVDEKQSVVG